mgnify:CR=1 FL=1
MTVRCVKCNELIDQEDSFSSVHGVLCKECYILTLDEEDYEEDPYPEE